MPTYDYKCEACGGGWELFQSMSAAPVKKCPQCGKNKAKRLIGTGAGLIFKGSGFYITDYRDAGYKDAAKKDTGDSASSGTSGDAAKSDAKPAEAKPAESKPSDSKPAEAKPAASKPAETKPAAAPAPSKSAKKK